MVDKNEALKGFDDQIAKFVPAHHRMDAMPTIGALTAEIRAQLQIAREAMTKASEAMTKVDDLLIKHDQLASKSAAGMLDIAAMWGK